MIAALLRVAGRAGVAAAFGLLLVAVPAAAQEQTPAEFLRDFSDTALERLSGDLDRAEREGRFFELLETGFDVPAISQFILARHWRAASEEERAAFVEVFKDYLSQRFLPLFGGGESAEFDLRFAEGQALQGRDDLFDVPVTFAPGSGGEPINTIWRVRARDGGYKILDVRAEGVSLAVTLRDEYSAVIRRTGGVAGLVEELRSLVESGQVTPAGPAQDG